MELVTLGEPFDRRDGRTGCLDGQHRARLDGQSVDVDGAGTTLAGVTADVRAGHVEVLAERLDEEAPGLDVELPRCPIDDERDVFAHGPDPPAAHTGTNALTPDVSARPSQPRRQPVSWVSTRSLDGGTEVPRNQVTSSSARAADGPGPTYPSAAARLLTARGSSEKRPRARVSPQARPPRGARSCGRVGPRQPGERRRGREAHLVRTATPVEAA